MKLWISFVFPLVAGGSLFGDTSADADLLGLDAARAPAYTFRRESYHELVDAEVDNVDFAAGPVAEIRYFLPKRSNRPAAFKAAIGPKSFVPGRYEDLAEREYGWLRSQQLPNGAIAKVNDATTVSVNPYFALEAVMGLLRGRPTGESRAAARRYFDWHFAHLNTAATDYSGHDGTIYDYTVELDRPGGVIIKESPTPTPEAGLRRTAEYWEPDHPMYDSVDSYAALLFVALADYARTPSGAAYARAHAADLVRVWNALDAAFDPSGFTHARLDYYNIQYLMDNCEVYAGLVAAEFLFGETLGDSARGGGGEGAARGDGRAFPLGVRRRRPFPYGDARLVVRLEPVLSRADGPDLPCGVWRHFPRRRTGAADGREPRCASRLVAARLVGRLPLVADGGLRREDARRAHLPVR